MNTAKILRREAKTSSPKTWSADKCKRNNGQEFIRTMPVNHYLCEVKFKIIEF